MTCGRKCLVKIIKKVSSFFGEAVRAASAAWNEWPAAAVAAALSSAKRENAGRPAANKPIVRGQGSIAGR